MTKALFYIISKFRNFYIHQITKQTVDSFASFGKGSTLGYPFRISGTNEYTPGIK